MDTVPDGFIIIDELGVILSFNKSAVKIFGYQPDEVIGKNVKTLMPEPYHSEHDSYLKNYRETGIKKIIGIGREIIAERKDGSLFPMELTVNEMEMEGQRQFLGVVRDISERKEAESAIQSHLNHITGIMDTVLDGLITIDVSGVILSFNRSAEQIFGYEADEVIGRNVKVLMPEPYHSEHDSYLKNYLSTGKKKVIGLGREIIAKRKDGSLFSMELGVNEMEVLGQTAFVGTIRDITERKESEKSIRSYIERLQISNQELDEKTGELTDKQVELESSYIFQDLVIDSLPGLVFVKDSEFRIVKANKAFINLYPDPNKVIGYTTIEDFPTHEAEAFLAKDREAFTTGYSEVVESITFPNGDVRILFTQKKQFKNAQQEQFILGVSSDVTERENLIKQLKKSNKDLEQFAYIASHDLKSPLNGIKRLVEWIEDDHAQEIPQKANEYFALIKNRVERMSGLLSDLLEYSRIDKQLVEEETISLLEFVQAIHELVSNSENYPISIPDKEVKLPRVALQIVLLNLISNSVKHHHKENGNIELQVEENSLGYTITFTDDGPGIPLRYHEKAFQMFQTLKTRDEVEGSGMGLALVKKIIDHYGGKIELEGERNPGCQFRLFWPVKNS